MRKVGNIIIISGPSGSGKTTLAAKVEQRLRGDVALSISYTTREKRAGEEEGIDYHFVSKEEFKKLEAAGDFLETALVYGHNYGTSKSATEEMVASGKDILLVIDIEGAKRVKEQFQSALMIYILPPSLEILQKRIENRGRDVQADIDKRLSAAVAEEQEAKQIYDHFVVNDEMERAVGELEELIKAC